MRNMSVVVTPTIPGDLGSSSSGVSSGNSSSSNSDVESESQIKTKCGICCHTLKSPKVLSCFHSFCLGCLQHIQETPTTVQCPVCHTETYLSSLGLSGLMPDYAVINIIEEKNFDISTATCGVCIGRDSAGGEGKGATGGEGIVAHCFDCCSFLCPNCEQAHRFMHCFDGHSFVPLSEVYPGSYHKLSKPMKCSRHREQTLALFCRSCSVPICKECTVLEHPTKGHECYMLNEVASHEIDGMLRLTKFATQRAMELRVATKNVEQSSLYLQQQYQKAKSVLLETHAFFVSVVEERMQNLLKDLDAAFNDKQVTLSSTAQDIQDAVLKVGRACEFVNKLVNHASPAEALICKNMIESKLRSVVEYIPDAGANAPNAYDIEFTSCKQNIQAAVRNSFGLIRQSRNGSTVFRRTSVPNITQNQILDNLAAASSIIQANSLLAANELLSNTPPASMGHFDASILNGLVSSSNGLSGSISHWNGSGSGSTATTGDIFSSADMFTLGDNEKSSKSDGDNTPPKSSLPRTKMVFAQKFGEFGMGEAQFTEPSGVAVNTNGDIIVADTNNHRIQIFDKNGDFKFLFGHCGKRDGQLLYPNRVAVCKKTGNIIVTERSPTHQVQIFTKDGAFVRKFGSGKLQHPRGVTVDNQMRIIIVECKVMRVIIFDPTGVELSKFGCSKHLEFPNGVVVNDREEIFISDNRSHCVKVFSYSGQYLRQIGGEGLTNYPIGVGITLAGEILIADNHNNFNVTVFKQDGTLVAALESRIKHAQCFDVALGEDGTIVLASRDFRVYTYNYNSPSGPSPPESASSIGSASNFLFNTPQLQQLQQLQQQLPQFAQLPLDFPQLQQLQQLNFGNQLGPLDNFSQWFDAKLAI